MAGQAAPFASVFHDHARDREAVIDRREEAGLLTRDSRKKETKVRSQEGAQGSPVLEAVIVMTVQFGTDGIRGEPPTKSQRPGLPAGTPPSPRSSPPTSSSVYDTRESSPTPARAVLAGLRDGAGARVTSVTSRRPVSRSSPNSARRRGRGVGLAQSRLRQRSEGPRTRRRQTRLRDGTGGRRSAERRRSGSDRLLRRVRDRRIGRARLRAHLRSLVPRTLVTPHRARQRQRRASHVAHEVFESTGARHDDHEPPERRNINENAARTHIEDLVAHVLELHATRTRLRR